MITVVVVAVLATIAYPSYSAYVARARRAEVKATLLDAAAWMEQNFVLQGNSYLTPAPDTDLATAGFDRSPRGAAQPFYSIAFRSTPTATRFELVATPNAAVWAEPLCTELSIDQDGARTATGSWSATDCWNR